MNNEILNIENTNIRSKVLITGLGRSGTSLIASIIKSIGYHMPYAYKLATNEDSQLRQLLKNGEIQGIKLELDDRVKKHHFVAWKDPKIFSHNGIELNKILDNEWVYILVFRDPYSIASRNIISQKSDDLDAALYEAAHNQKKLVTFYNLIKIKNPTYLISYEKFLSNKKQEIEKIADFLKININDQHITQILNNAQKDHEKYLKAQKGN